MHVNPFTRSWHRDPATHGAVMHSSISTQGGTGEKSPVARQVDQAAMGPVMSPSSEYPGAHSYSTVWLNVIVSVARVWKVNGTVRRTTSLTSSTTDTAPSIALPVSSATMVMQCAGHAVGQSGVKLTSDGWELTGRKHFISNAPAAARPRQLPLVFFICPA